MLGFEPANLSRKRILRRDRGRHPIGQGSGICHYGIGLHTTWQVEWVVTRDEIEVWRKLGWQRGQQSTPPISLVQEGQSGLSIRTQEVHPCLFQGSASLYARSNNCHENRTTNHVIPAESVLST